MVLRAHPSIAVAMCVTDEFVTDRRAAAWRTGKSTVLKHLLLQASRRRSRPRPAGRRGCAR